MKIWLISDTRTAHERLSIPKDIDTVCFIGGACSKGSYKTGTSSYEFLLFLNWFEALDIEHKIVVPGAVDRAVENGNININGHKKVDFLIDSAVIIDGIKFYGSPFTNYSKINPMRNSFVENEFGLAEKWNEIPINTDVLLTHMPPFGILDKVAKQDNTLLTESIGSKSLRHKSFKIAPKVHAFGHTLDDLNVLNGGSYKSPSIGTVYINASCTIEFGNKLIHNGIIMDI